MTQAEAPSEQPVPAVRTIVPYRHPAVADLLSRPQALFDMARLHAGPVHLIFPQVMAENIERFQALFAAYDFEARIHYTTKPNRSDVFIRQAYISGVNIDVSSLGELQAALGAGFRGPQIGCTNTKNRQYLWLALEQDCLISVDNRLELEWIAAMAPVRRHRDTPVRILLRITDLQPLDRKIIRKAGKFGIPVADLPDIYALLRENPAVKLEGFHFHHSNPNPELQAGYLEHALRLVEDAAIAGFDPSIIDMGGGYRCRHLEEPRQWQAFVEEVEEALVLQKDTGVWGNRAYGMYVNERGRISGRDNIQSLGATHDPVAYLREVFGNTGLRGRPLGDCLSEHLLTIIVEPGRSLLHQCGITLLPVKGVKHTADGSTLIMTDASIYNTGMQFKEPAADFILVPRVQEPNAAPCEGYVVDNICNEHGIICKRRMAFSQTPREGDLLVMVDTAAYVSDFEDAGPHRHPLGKKFVAIRHDAQWSFCAEDQYWPYGQKKESLL